MKFKKLSYLSFLGILALGLTCSSCDKDLPGENGTNTEKPEGGSENGENGGDDTPDDGTILTPLQQKEKLSAIGQEFMNAIPSSDFDDITNTLQDVSDKYGENYNWENVEEWAEDCWEKTLEYLGQETENYDYGYYVSTYIYKNYKQLLLASNFIGHFEAKNGGWQSSKASNLQFSMPNENYVVKLETSGGVKKVYVGNWEDYDGWDSYPNDNGNYNYTDYYDRYACTIGVPETITLTFSKGGDNIIKCVVTTNISGTTSEDKIDISKCNLSVTTQTEFNNGYKINVSQCQYSANQNAQMAMSVTKNSSPLVKMEMSTELSNIPSFNADAFVSEDYDDDDLEEDFENANAKNTYINVDIMGKLQVQGKVSNARKMYEYWEEAEDNKYEESTYKSYINQVNSLADIKMFFDGKSTAQAYVIMEPFYKESDWNGSKYWEAEPVICFFDGSSYSSFEAFFNESDFRNIIDQFEKLLEEYTDIVESFDVF
ncbi:MAG: hypothetical protein IKL71_06155 [Bacteroidaceae bacterium]|nr:hypothetical protein [Bacteroidaceae bacterium]